MLASRIALGTLALVASASAASAQTYTETFSATFPAWETDWFGANTDAYNYYCSRPCANRGNNPAGLWIGGINGPSATAPVVVNFNPTFGAGITRLSLDVSGFTATNLQAFDMANTLIFDQAIALTGDVNVGANYIINSANGISRFGFTAANASGNTSIDNVTVNAALVAVPEPGTWALLGTGLLAIGGVARRRRAAGAA